MLNPVIAPTAATNKNITWSSSNNNIATVTNNGLVVAMNVGTATITAITVDGGFSASVTINVVDPPLVSSVTGKYYNGNSNSVGAAPTKEQLNTGGSVEGAAMPGFAEDVVSSLTSTQAYFGRGGGVAIGSSSNAGFLKITLNNAYATKRVEVLFNDTKLSSTPSLKGMNGSGYETSNGTIGTQHSNPSSGTPYILTFPSEVTYFEIHATKRIAIVEISIIIDSPPETTPEAEAEIYSAYFLDITAEGCNLSNETLLFNAWEFAEDEFDDLSFIAKTIMQNSDSDASSNDIIKQAKARYNFINYKYNFHDFMNGETYTAMQVVPESNDLGLIIVLLTLLVAIGVFSVVIHKR